MKQYAYITVIFFVTFCTLSNILCGNELGNMKSAPESTVEELPQKQAIIAYLENQKKKTSEEPPALSPKKSRSSSMRNGEIYHALRNRDFKTIHQLLQGTESTEPIDISDDKLFNLLIRTCFAQPMGRLKESLQKRLQEDKTLLEKSIHDNGKTYSLLEYLRTINNPDAIEFVKNCL